jgi:hypothetical protein
VFRKDGDYVLPFDRQFCSGLIKIHEPIVRKLLAENLKHHCALAQKRRDAAVNRIL